MAVVGSYTPPSTILISQTPVLGAWGRVSGFGRFVQGFRAWVFWARRLGKMPNSKSGGPKRCVFLYALAWFGGPRIGSKLEV